MEKRDKCTGRVVMKTMLTPELSRMNDALPFASVASDIGMRKQSRSHPDMKSEVTAKPDVTTKEFEK